MDRKEKWGECRCIKGLGEFGRNWRVKKEFLRGCEVLIQARLTNEFEGKLENIR